MPKSKDPWVLGISASHNGAACLLRGDEIAVAIQEERLSRKKRHRIHGAQHSLALDYCFSAAGIAPRQLSAAVLTVQGKSNSPTHDLKLNPFLRIDENRIPASIISHHMAHAVSAFATSGFPEAAVLVIDGIGSPAQDLSDAERNCIKNPCDEAWEIISLYHASGTEVVPLEKHVTEGRKWLGPGRTTMPRFRSLGGIFSSAAVQIFGGDLEAGKVMGLAPYGRPIHPVESFFEIKEGRFEFSDSIPEKFQHADRWPLRQQEYSDLAASVQNALECALLYLVGRLHELSGSVNLCYAGGVALNSVANERIIRESKFKNVYIIPAAEDSGPAIGAAYYGLWRETGKNTRRRLMHDALGREYSAQEVVSAIRKTPAVEVVQSADPVGEAIDLLVDGKIIGWFQGRSELGPRALGQRSIICDPRRPDGKDVLNSKVKHRESFRPFAPVIMLEHTADWFDLEGTNPESEFMLRVCKFKTDKAHQVPAVVHEDGTGRVQTVTREANGPFYDLIRRFNEKTGVPIILNTSFNINGMPIVETPQDALLCLLSTGLDYCVIENTLVRKRESVLLGSRVLSSMQRAPAPLKKTGDRFPGMQSRRVIDDYTGEYSNANGVLTIDKQEEVLSGTYNNITVPLVPAAPDVFESAGESFKGYSVSFIPDRTGFFSRAVVNPGDGSEIVFSRESGPKKLDHRFAKACAGEYQIEDITLRVAFAQGRLTVTAAGQPEYVLLPRDLTSDLTRDTGFILENTPGYSVEFVKDENGHVTGALVTQPNGVFLLTKVK